MTADPVRLLMLGGGSRALHAYGDWCLRHPQRAKVVAVAEPDARRRDAFADRHGIGDRWRFRSWDEALGARGNWHAVVVATPDRMHVDPTIRALEQDHDVLLEKPIAQTPDDIARLARAAAHGPGAVTVAHGLRYTPVFSTIKRIIDEGRLGDIQAIQHTENIGYGHFAHSYVRGNWHRSAASSPMLLAKACHDLDLLRWFVGRPCRRLSSFGHLSHFRLEHAPDGSMERCRDGCAVAETCPCNAVRFYTEELAGTHGHPVTAVTRDTTHAGRMRALAETDYGRCVYRMDNDVVDHQVVNLDFDGGVTATLMVSAFTAQNTRTIHVMGSHGELRGHMERGEIAVTRFRDAPSWPVPRRPVGATEVFRLGPIAKSGQADGYAHHAGADDRLMDAFVTRVRERHATGVAPPALTSLQESL